MFSDQPVTPKRLEILVEVVTEYGRSSTLRRDKLLELLQPDTLPDYSDNSRVAGEQTLAAARDLGLVEEIDGGWDIPKEHRNRSALPTRERVLAALDERVLGDTQIEPYFGPFYSYLLGLSAEADTVLEHQEWANRYNNAVHGRAATPNPLNATKMRGLWRWYPYVGLGWADSSDVFQCEPYERVRRALPRLFGKQRRLDADEFMASLAEQCAELDGGRIFRAVNPVSTVAARVTTLGLAQALIQLHEDQVLVLDCPPDSRGWDISAADPPNDGATVRSTRLDAVEWTAAAARKRRIP